MLHFRPSVFAAVVLTIALPASAWADVIVNSFYQKVSACINSTARFECESPDTRTSDVWTQSVTLVSPIDAGEATAEQTGYVAASQSGVTSFGATANSTATAMAADVDTFVNTSANTMYVVNFTLTEAYAYVLGGTFANVTTDLANGFYTYYQLVLEDSTTRARMVDVFGQNNTNAADLLSLSGILAPGDYRLYSITQGAAISNTFGWGGATGGTSFASASFDLDLTSVAAATPVPEPASMLLLGTGLAGAGLRRWRQKRA